MVSVDLPVILPKTGSKGFRSGMNYSLTPVLSMS